MRHRAVRFESLQLFYCLPVLVLQLLLRVEHAAEEDANGGAASDDEEGAADEEWKRARALGARRIVVHRAPRVLEGASKVNPSSTQLRSDLGRPRLPRVHVFSPW